MMPLLSLIAVVSSPIGALRASRASEARRVRRGGLIRYTDGQLAERILAGEEAAFETLVRRYQGSLLRLASSLVSSQALAEEVVQETWMGVLKGLKRFERRAALKTWIFRILINRAKTRGAREARTVPFSAFGDAGDDDYSAVDPQRFTAKGAWAAPPGRWHEALPEERLLGKDTMTVMRDVIAGLAPNQRAVITLRDIEDVESREVCNILKISETNQRVLLHRARSQVRAALEQYFGEASQA